MDISDIRTSADLAHVDFLAENTLVTVHSNRRSSESLDLASVKLDRFRLYERREVPLWVGRMLERKGQATIERPPWLEVEALKATIAEERRLTMEALSEVPEFLESVAKKLLRPEEDATVLVHDLIAIRRSKILATVKTLDLRFVHANVKTWTAMERTMFRVGALGMLDQINALVGQNLSGTEPLTQDSLNTSQIHSG